MTLAFNHLNFSFFADVPFPKIFSATAKKILTRLFRVFVHVYIHHFDKVQAIGAVSYCLRIAIVFESISKHKKLALNRPWCPILLGKPKAWKDLENPLILVTGTNF